MNEHPLITAMKRAGDHTRRQADWLARTNYGDNENGIGTNMHYLSDALMYDWMGGSAIHDLCILNDRDHPDRAVARNRTDLRISIREALERFPAEYREHLIDQLAAGNGAEAAHALRTTADRKLAMLLHTLRQHAEERCVGMTA